MRSLPLTARPRWGTVWVRSAIELGPLSDRLDEEEIKPLGRLLEQAGAKLPAMDDHVAQSFAKRLNEEAMTEFIDRLNAHDVAADIYLPIEFEGPLSVGELRVASAYSLQETLEEMNLPVSVKIGHHRPASFGYSRHGLGSRQSAGPARHGDVG